MIDLEKRQAKVPVATAMLRGKMKRGETVSIATADSAYIAHVIKASNGNVQ